MIQIGIKNQQAKHSYVTLFHVVADFLAYTQELFLNIRNTAGSFERGTRKQDKTSKSLDMKIF